MLLFAGAVKFVQTVWDNVNTTVEEVKQRIDELSSSIQTLESEYNSLLDAGRENLTDAETARLDYLEDRIEKEKELKELEEARMIREEHGSKFTDYFDKDNYMSKYSDFRKKYFDGMTEEGFRSLSHLVNNNVDGKNEKALEAFTSLDEYNKTSKIIQDCIEKMENSDTESRAYKSASKKKDKAQEKLGDLQSTLQEEYSNYSGAKLEAEKYIEELQTELKNPYLSDEVKKSIEAHIEELEGTIRIADYFLDKFKNTPSVSFGKDGYSNWYSSLSDDEKALTKSEDFKKIIESTKESAGSATLTIEDYNKALTETKNLLSTSPDEISISFEESLKGIQDLSKGLDQLKSVYNDIKNGGEFDFSSILNNEDFTNTFGDFKEEYDDFIITISNSPNDINACQSAFDNLVTAYINGSDVLSDLTEKNKDVAISMLESMGITNAKSIVMAELTAKTKAATLSLDEYNDTELKQLISSNGSTESLYEKVGALLQDKDMTDGACASLINLVAQTTIFNNTKLSVADKIEALKNLAKSAGLAADSFATAAGVMGNDPRFMNLQTSFSDLIEEKFGSYKPQVNYTAPPSKSSSGSGSSSSSQKEDTTDYWKKAFEEKYKALKHSLAMGEITEKKYYDSVNKLNQKYFADKEQYLDEYRQYEEEVYNGREKVYKASFDKEYNNLKHKLEMGKITEKQYYDSLKKLNNKYFKGNKKYSDEYKKYQEEIFKGLQKLYKQQVEDTMSYLKKLLDANSISVNEYVSKTKETITKMWKSGKISAEDYFSYTAEMLKNELSAYDSVLSAVSKAYDSQIDALKEKQKSIDETISSLKEENDEHKRALELEKAKYQLYQAQNNRTVKLFNGEEFVYTSDQKAVKDAQQTLDDLEFEETIRALEKEKEAIDKEIEKLEEFKKEWSKVANVYNDAQDKMKTASVLGADWEKSILKGRLDVLKKFKKQYIKIQKEIADANVQAANAAQTTTKTAASGTSSSSNIKTFQEWYKNVYGGKLDVKANGKKDANTEKAIKEIQGKVGISKTGNFDSKLYDKIIAWSKRQKKTSKVYKDTEKKLKSIKKAKFAQGGVVQRNIKPTDIIRELDGEDAIIAAKQGERILTPIQNELWEKWTNAIPDLQKSFENNILPLNKGFNPDLTGVTKKQVEYNVSIGDIHLHDVQNVDGLANAIIRELPNKITQRLGK